MSRKLLELLKIQPGEGLKVFQLALLGLLLQAGLAIGISAADSLFLLHVGSAKLPIIYILTPIVMLGYIPLYSYLLNRLGIEWVFRFTIVLLTGGGVLFALSLSWWADSTGLYYLLKLYVTLWFIAQYSLYWNFIDGYFDILDAKRLFSLLSSGCALGAIIGGAAVNPLTQVLPVSRLFAVWACCAFLALPVLWWIRKKQKVITSEESLDNRELGVRELLRQIHGSMKGSRYVKFFVVTAFVSLITTTFCEYQYLGIFSLGLSEAQLTRLFGRLFAGVNVFNLIFSMFIYNRLVLRIGVCNMAMVQPAAYLTVFAFLLVDFGFESALLGFFAYQGLMATVTYDTNNLLLNGIPASVKNYVRTFVDGMSEPMATATAGLFLLFFATDLGAESISLIGLGLAGSYFLLTLLVRGEYLRAMIDNMRSGWLDFTKPIDTLVRHITPDDLTLLQRKAQSPDFPVAQTAIQLLSLQGRSMRVESLLEYAQRASDPERRITARLLGSILDDGDPSDFQLVLTWLETQNLLMLDTGLIQELGERGLIPGERLQPFIQHENPAYHSAAIAALRGSWRFEEVFKSMNLMRKLLDDDWELQLFVQALGRTGTARFAYDAASYLHHEAPGVRQAAYETISRLADRDTDRLLPDILNGIQCYESEQRLFGMDALIRIGDTGCIAPLLQMADSFAPHEKRKAEMVIVRLGLQSIPTTVSVLRDPSFPLKGRSVAARALGKLSFPQLELLSPQLIRDELRYAYEFLRRCALLRQEVKRIPERELLMILYRNLSRGIVSFVLELLTIGGKLPDYELLFSSLSSGNPKEQGNAIETIEQGVSRDVFSLLLPLIDEQRQAGWLNTVLPAGEQMEKTVQEVLIKALHGGSPLECSIAAQALWREGPNGRELLRRELPSLAVHVSREIFYLLVREAAQDESLTALGKMYALTQSPFFASLEIQELQAIAAETEERTIEADSLIYSTGDPAVALYVVIHGAVHLASAVGVRKCRAGDVFGEAGVFGRATYRETAVSEGTRILIVPAEQLLKHARNMPRMAVELFMKAKAIQAEQQHLTPVWAP